MRQFARKLLQRLGRAKPPLTASNQPTTGPALKAAGYDKLHIDSVLAHVDKLAPKDLAKLGDHERTHQNRTKVLAEIDARLGHEPWPGYDGLDVNGVRFGLDGADPDRFVMVLAYERAHLNRAGVVLAAQQNAG